MWWIFRIGCLVVVLGTVRWWWPFLRSLRDERRPLRWTAAVVVVGALGFALAQLIPLGWGHPNPAIVREPVWDSPATRDLAVAACFDCHSNEAQFPWYANVAPVSWLVLNDVVGGRDHLNFSEWNGGRRRNIAGEAARTIERGSMPPVYYTWIHAASQLTGEQKTALADGLRASLATP